MEENQTSVDTRICRHGILHDFYSRANVPHLVPSESLSLLPSIRTFQEVDAMVDKGRLPT